MKTAQFGRAVAAGLMFAGAALAGQPASAQTTLVANSQWPETHTGSQVDKWWAREIERRTDGEVKINLFFGEALGKAGENLNLLKDGAIDIAMMSPGYFPGELPFHAAPNSIPMSMTKLEHATELMRRLKAEVPAFRQEAKRHGSKTLFFHHLNPYKLVCTEPAKSLADLEGRKLRTWGKDMPRLAEAAGMTPVTLKLPELYEALDRGAVDCIPFSVDLMANYKIYEVAKHVMNVTLWLGPTNGTWIAREAWNDLSEEQQSVIETVSRRAAIRDRKATLEAGNEARATLKDKGVKFHDFPDAEVAKWKRRNPDFFADFIAEMEERGKGDDARRAVEIWREVTG